jgi:hypothetical protein
MKKPKRSISNILQHSAVLTIAIISLTASFNLAGSGIAPLTGAPDNPTSRAIERIVDAISHWLAHNDDGVANIVLLQAPIALLTYLFVVALPLVVGFGVIECWLLAQPESRSAPEDGQ